MWTFHLVQASDMTRLGEFTAATGRELNVILNRSGSYSCTVDLTDPIANLVTPGSTGIEAVKNGVTVWSGLITSSQITGGRSLRLQAVGWFETLKRRVVRDFGTLPITLVNSGLESGSETGWTFLPGTHSVSTVAPRTGTYAELLSTPDDTGVAMYQTFTHPVGVNVTATVWVRRTAASVAFEDTDLQLKAYTASGTTVGTLINYATTNPGLTYAQMSITWVTTTSGSAIVLDNGPLNPTGGLKEIYADDFAVTYESLSFTNTDIGEIAQTILDATNRSDTAYVTRGGSQPSWTRTIRYLPFQNVGDEIQRMSDVENGFDFEVHPNTRQLHVYYPAKGVFRGNYDPPTNAIVKSAPSMYYTFANGSVSSEPNQTSLGAAYDMTIAGTVNTLQPPLTSFEPSGLSKTATAIATAGGSFGSFATVIDLSGKSYSYSGLFSISTLTNVTELVLMYNFDGSLNSGCKVLADGSMTIIAATGATLTAPAGTIAPGTIYHFCVTFDNATLQARLYINGNLVTTGVGTAALASSGGTGNGIFTAIAVRRAGAGTPDVRLDEWAIWQGRSLSPAEVTFHYQSLRLKTPTSINPDIRFGFGKGPMNVSGYTMTTSTDKMSNWVVTQGRGSSTGSGALAKDPASIATYRAFDEVSSLSQVDSLQVLAAYSNATIAVRGRPVVIYEFTPLPTSGMTDGLSIPEPFTDYNVGDIVVFDLFDQAVGRDGTTRTIVNVADQNIRIFGITVTFTDEGDEQVKLTTSPGT